MNRRLELIRESISRRTLGGSLYSWLLSCFGPRAEFLAKRGIKSVREEGDYLVFRVKGCAAELYYPRKLHLRHFHQVLAEQLYAWQWHYYQIPHTRVNADDIVFDCGAAEGLFTALAAPVAKHAYAFEPLPLFVEALGKTFAAVPNASVVGMALGRTEGTARMSDAGINSTIGASGGFEVQVTTIDSFCDKNKVTPTFLKADLEGAEMEVLGGAIETIRRCRPKIAITTYHVESHCSEITTLLKDIHPDYNILSKGIERRRNAPVMLHAW